MDFSKTYSKYEDHFEISYYNISTTIYTAFLQRAFLQRAYELLYKVIEEKYNEKIINSEVIIDNQAKATMFISLHNTICTLEGIPCIITVYYSKVYVYSSIVRIRILRMDCFFLFINCIICKCNLHTMYPDSSQIYEHSCYPSFQATF